MAPAETSTTATSTSKRKRAAADQGQSRPSPNARTSESAAGADEPAPASSYDEGQLSQLLAQSSGSHGQTGPNTSIAETAAAALTNYQVPASFESAGQSNTDSNIPFGMEGGSFSMELKEPQSAQHGSEQPNPQPPVAVAKPPVGSDEWHRIRRDNHKEVERRRREAINEGINELSKIVPGTEKNKGSILQRAVQYIGQLKENEQQNIEKWTLEKLLLDQAITELSATAERLKNEAKYYQKKAEIYREACESNGIEPPEAKELESEANRAAEE